MKRVSVTIPCRNEERYIQRCIMSVLQSDYPAELLRVVVCDGRSTDQTPHLVAGIAASDNRVVLLLNEQQTTPFALNLGIRYSTDADVHIILGAHAEIAPDYIRRCVDHLQRDPMMGCVGGILDNIHEDETSAAIGAAMSSPFGVGNAHFRTGTREGYVDTVAFGAYRKEVFDRCGYFDEELIRNQDDEFNFRLSKAGFRIYLDPGIRAKYYVRASYSKLWKQYYQYGLWKVYVNKKHKVVTSVRQLVPPLFVFYLFVGVILSGASDTIGLLWGLGLMTYIVTAFVFSTREMKEFSQTPAIVLSFFILHCSYGLGFWEGLFRFVLFGQKPAIHHSHSSR